jgi:hypothetical protein
MNKPLPTKSLEEVAMMLILRPARTEAGKVVHAAVLSRVEAAIAANKGV